MTGNDLIAVIETTGASREYEVVLDVNGERISITQVCVDHDGEEIILR